MTTHYISTLGVAKCREILKGAHEWAVFWITQNEYHISMLSFPNMTNHSSYLISNLRHELSLHDTDDFTHLANHIGPNTKVVG